MSSTKKSKTRKKTKIGKAATKTKAAVKSAVKSKSPAVGLKSKSPAVGLESRLFEPLAEMEKMLKQFRRGDWFGANFWDRPEFPSLFDKRMPSVDVVDKPKEIIVKAEIPGIDEDDLQVTVTDHTLTIKGETRHEEETEEGDLHRREIRRGSFYRTLNLPADVDGGKAKAKCKNGMLELHLPKARTVKQHSITVN